MMRSRRMGPALLALVLASAAPAAMADHLGPEDTNALHLNVLLYHPLPDEQGDPWGVPAVLVNGTWRDWMAAYYGAFFFPTAVFDGVLIMERIPVREGAGPVEETAAAYRDAMDARLGQDSPLRLRLEGATGDGFVTVNGTITGVGRVQEPGLELRLALFEDDVAYNGGNGIVNHRSVVRAIEYWGPVGELGQPRPFGTTFPVPSAWNGQRLGVVAFVQNTNEASREFDFKEVVQAATWRSSQSGPTVQASRGVLLELYSATWCDACVPGDLAADNLANEFGLKSSRLGAYAFEYLRPGEWWIVVMAVVAGAGGTLLLVRPRRPGPQEA